MRSPGESLRGLDIGSARPSEEHVRAYHEILKLEAASYGRPEKERGGCLGGQLCKPLAESRFCIEVDRAREAVSRLGLDTSLIDDLIAWGALLEVAEGCLRSYHFDWLLRIAFFKPYPNSPSHIVSLKYTLVFKPIGYPSDRRVSLRSSDGLGAEIKKLVASRIGEDLAGIYIDAFMKYLESRGGKGLTYYQALAVKRALEEPGWKGAYALSAPVGSGKSEIFMFLAMLYVLESKVAGNAKKAALIYPRKALEASQAERLIELLFSLNSMLEETGWSDLKVALYVRDGDTARIREAAQRGEEIAFRGITFKGRLLKVAPDGRVYFEDEGGKFVIDFVKPFQGPDASKADVIVSNVHTLLYRSVSQASDDYDLDGVFNTDYFVVDEAHEYAPILLAALGYTFRSLRLIGEEGISVLVSSATLPDPVGLASRLAGVSREEVVDLSFSTLSRAAGQRLGAKAEIIAMAQVNPQVSWQTFLAELASAYLYAAGTLEGSPFTPQAIFFIDNIRELQRFDAILRNSIRAGSPRKLVLCGESGDSKWCDPLSNPAVLAHYPGSYDDSVRERIAGLHSIIHSAIPVNEKARIYNALSKGSLKLVAATSSLEVGVDYPQISMIVNAGFDRLPSLIQRFGRGGRSTKSLYTALNIILVKPNPLEYSFYADASNIMKVLSESMGGAGSKYWAHLSPKSLVPLETPAAITYALIRHLAMKMLRGGVIVKPVDVSDVIERLYLEVERGEADDLIELVSGEMGISPSRLKTELLEELRRAGKAIRQSLKLYNVVDDILFKFEMFKEILLRNRYCLEAYDSDASIKKHLKEAENIVLEAEELINGILEGHGVDVDDFISRKMDAVKWLRSRIQILAGRLQGRAGDIDASKLKAMTKCMDNISTSIQLLEEALASLRRLVKGGV